MDNDLSVARKLAVELATRRDNLISLVPRYHEDRANLAVRGHYVWAHNPGESQPFQVAYVNGPAIQLVKWLCAELAALDE